MYKFNTNRYYAWLLPASILLLIMVGFAFSLYINRLDLAIRGMGIAIPALLAAFLLVILYRSKENLLEKPIVTIISQKMLVAIFTIVFTASIAFLLFSPEKTWLYYLIISVLSVTILFQILLPKTSPGVVLVEIILSLLGIIYGVTLTQPLYFGFTDILMHIRIADITYLAGQVIPPDFDLDYANFPLYHLFLAAGSLVTGLDIKTVLFVLTAPVYAMIVVFIYYTFSKMFKNTTVPLLACLAFAFSSTGMFYGTYMITRVMAFIGFIVMLYFLFKNDHSKNADNRAVGNSFEGNIAFNALAVLMALFIILVHQVSVIEMSMLLFILLACEWVSGNLPFIKVKFFTFFNAMFIVYWLYVAYDFTRGLIGSKFNAENFQTGNLIRDSIKPSNVVPFLLNNLDVSLFLFFAILGIGYILLNAKNNNKNVLAICLFCLATLALFVPSPVQTLWQTIQLFRFDRFVLLLAPFMALTMGIGIFILYNYMSKLKIPGIICLLTISLLFGGYALASSDLKNLSADTPRDYFIEGELSGFGFVNDHVPYDSMLSSDIYTVRYFGGSYKLDPMSDLDLPQFDVATFDVPTTGNSSGYKIFRYNELQDHGLYLGNIADNPYYYTTNEDKATMTNDIQSNSVIFSNNDLDVYKK